MERRRLLIVDDHPVVRRGLRTMLETEDWVAGIAEAATVAQALAEAVSSGSDVIAMDLLLPDGCGIDATARIMHANPEALILILTMTDDQDVVARALRAGAKGYLLKDTDPDTIVDALRTVAGGGVVLGPRIGATVLTAFERAPATQPPPFDRLTARERDILGGLAAGLSNARIARHLGLSEKTVRNQMSGVFDKLGVSDRVQAALMARKAGFD